MKIKYNDGDDLVDYTYTFEKNARYVILDEDIILGTLLNSLTHIIFMLLRTSMNREEAIDTLLDCIYVVAQRSNPTNDQRKQDESCDEKIR